MFTCTVGSKVSVQNKNLFSRVCIYKKGSYKCRSCKIVCCQQTKYRLDPQIFHTKKGEKCIFQAGETILIEEVPENTRVVYPGVRAKGERDENKVRQMIKQAILNPVGDDPLPKKLQLIKEKKGTNASIVIAFDDVSVPLPPMKMPDTRQIIMEEVESLCVQQGLNNIKFICSIALHRYIRPDEFRHICGRKLYNKYFSQGRMINFNAVDKQFSKVIGTTRHGEEVRVCNEFADADLAVYANVNYVAMDGGYKSYATGMVHYESLKVNHDAKTLKATKSLYDPARSELHKSFYRIGKIIQNHVDIFHIETVLDEETFPWYLAWCSKLLRQHNFIEKLLARLSVFFLKFVPLFIRKWIFWSFIVRAPFGLVQVTAGETEAVHKKTLESCYQKVTKVKGQSDIVILAPTCIGPYTKDYYMNPLLVNTYALGYYYNMYVGGKALLKDGGVAIVVNSMHYAWSSPNHDCYKELFEKVIKDHGGLDEFEKFQEEYATNERLNDIYRKGEGPAGVHGFYMYTWAAHGMDKIGKVFVVGATDSRGPQTLGWTECGSVVEAVEKAKEWLGNKDATVSYMRSPPVGYVEIV
eukprot:TRINITY_DN23133_c0_g2_i1.p1 TRINITY_DN23133_c0_g2~~TRINITY_DN23133_c0_g2_i1.p1  ORF type:complete len:582 (-),score=54.49 TRINITY_DN23133_c0_g2_i1:240-1985(-)